MVPTPTASRYSEGVPMPQATAHVSSRISEDRHVGIGGSSRLQLLRAEANAGIRSSQKSIIFIYLVGGPPHQDMFDLKPKATAEIAGPWRPIATNVPGVEICEAFPRLAKMMDKFTIVRSIVGSQADHDAIQVFNGRDPRKPKPGGGWPQFGSVVAQMQGPVDPSVPAFVSLCYPCTHPPYNEPGPGFLGSPFGSFRPIDPGRKEVGFRDVDRRSPGRPQDPSEDARRRPPLRGYAPVDPGHGRVQRAGVRAPHIVEGGDSALDLSKEDPRTVARYGTGDPTSSSTTTALHACRRAC